MTQLKDFIVRFPESENKYFPIIAAKILPPEGSAFSWGTTIRFEDGIQAFVTVDRKFLEIMNGRTIEDCYKAYTGKTLGFFEKRRNTEFSVYAYRSIIDGCSVGTKLMFKDIEDGVNKYLSTYWNYSLKVMDSQRLINEVAAVGGKIETDYCSQVFRERGNLHGILDQVLSQVLLDTPFSQLQTRMADISDMVKREFINRGGYSITGFELESFTLGDFGIAED